MNANANAPANANANAPANANANANAPANANANANAPAYCLACWERYGSDGCYHPSEHGEAERLHRLSSKLGK